MDAEWDEDDELFEATVGDFDDQGGMIPICMEGEPIRPYQTAVERFVCGDGFVPYSERKRTVRSRSIVDGKPVPHKKKRRR